MEEELTDFRQRLESHLPGLTKSQQRIASYLLASYDEAAFLPAADLADRLDLSEATIVRFARANGVDFIVLGASGSSELDKTTFGSTAENVARRAHCTVMAIRFPGKIFNL